MCKPQFHGSKVHCLQNLGSRNRNRVIFIGLVLRENLQETMGFPVNFPLNQSIQIYLRNTLTTSYHKKPLHEGTEASLCHGRQRSRSHPMAGRKSFRLKKCLNWIKTTKLEIEVCTALNLSESMSEWSKDQVRTLERELQQLKGRRDAWNQVAFPVLNTYGSITC